MLVKGTGKKGKVCPRTGHEGTEGENRHSSTLSLTSALDKGGLFVNSTAQRNDNFNYVTSMYFSLQFQPTL
jgi:hypothetical protein